MKWRNLGVLFFEAHERTTESLIAAFALCCFQVDKKEMQQFICAGEQRLRNTSTSSLLQCFGATKHPFAMLVCKLDHYILIYLCRQAA